MEVFEVVYNKKKEKKNDKCEKNFFQHASFEYFQRKSEIILPAGCIIIFFIKLLHNGMLCLCI